MSFFTYVLKCADASYYVGHSDNLEHRIGQHQSGLVEGYTSTRLPVELMWSENFPTREEALAAEQQIKGWSRAKKEALFRGDWSAIQRLASRARVLRDENGPSTSSVPVSPQDERLGVGPFAQNSVRAEEGLKNRPIDSLEAASRSPVSKHRAPPPVIILVRPQLGQNIGKAARAMLNFGLTEMRLVAPRDGWPNPEAGPAASGADIVLANATVHETLAEAVADCSQVFATTVRRRDLIMPVVDPAEAATLIHGEAGRSALVFGPERSGLDSDDVALARMILTVPINPEFGSLNLAQAVILAAYEWSKGVALAQPPLADLDPPAPQDDLEGLIEATNVMLEKIDYFRPAARKVTTLRNIRTLLTKPRWTAKEVQMMRGILRGIERGPRGE